MADRCSPRHIPAYTNLAVLAIYAALACITTWPLAARLATHLPGNSTDSLLHYWNGWWVQTALNHGQSPLYTPYLFYPTGASLITHNLAWFNILPWLLLKPLLGGIMAYNVVLLASLVLCGFAAFVLARELTGNVCAAFVAGFIYQAWPFRISQLDHPNLVSTQWAPLFLLFLVYTIRKGLWRDALLAALFFLLAGYTRWQQLIPVTIMGLTYFLCTAPSWLPNGRRYVLTRLVVAGGIACLGMLPPFLLLLHESSIRMDAENLLFEPDERRMQTDLLAYVTPSSSHPLFGERTRVLYDRYYHDREVNRRYTSYVGFVAAALALAGVWRLKWKSLPWVAMALVLLSLAQGPRVRLDGEFYPQIPTLYRLLSPLYVVRLIRTPDRFNVFLALPVGVLAAYGTAGLLTGRQKWSQGLIVALLCGLALFEYLMIPVPVYRYPSDTIPFYEQVAQEPGEFAVLNLPFNLIESKAYMYEQTIHQRPIVQGNISRRYEQLYSYIKKNTLLNNLYTFDEIPPSLSDVSRRLATLAGDGIRYVVLHTTWVGEDRIAHWQRYLLAEPCYRDGRVIVYRTEPVAGRDFELLGELAPGLGPVEVLLSADRLAPAQTLEVDAGWGTTLALERDVDVVLSLVDNAGAVCQQERYPLSTAWPTSQWPANALVWGYYPLRLSESLPAGPYGISLALVEAASSSALGQPMSLGSLAVDAQPPNLATVPEAEDVNATFGDRLRLLEYQVRQEDGWLHLSLYWYLESRMARDYKVFVHVFDPATGIPVAQDDTMPHRGAYPISFWWPGERVTDQISISLQGVCAGTFGLAVGLYDPQTGERLSLVDRQGQSIADGRLILPKRIEMP